MNFTKMKQKLKYTCNWLLGRQLRVKIQTKHSFRRIGGEYGGIAVCLDALPPDPIIYSFGVGEDVCFDIEILDLTNGTIYAYDPTPKAIAYLRTIDMPSSFIFEPYAISDYDGDLEFHMPLNPNFVSGSLEATSNVSN